MAERRTRRGSSAPVPRKLPVQERSAVTVDAIVLAVEQILDRQGAEGLNTNRIAEVAGVSVGTLYQYFPNKESLVGAVHEKYLGQTLRFCRAALAGADGVPIVTVVERIGAALVAAARAQRTIHRWLYDMRTAAGFQERFRNALDGFVEELTAFLAARTDVRFPEPGAAAFVLVHGIAGIVTSTAERRRAETVDLEAVAASAVRMVSAYVDASR